MTISLVLYVVSFVLVAWAIFDIVRQPAWRMSRNRKLGWGLAAGIGWFFLGLVGAIVACVYLFAIRPRLEIRR